MIDYSTLRVIWWLIMGILLIGFAVMDGFDLGAAGLLPFVARKDVERRVVINTVGPVWEGNQVWFILGGGVLFAAWPYLYAVSFSGFYFAMFLVLATFIMRPVGFKYRSKIENNTWRSVWDWILCLSGIIAALTFGVAIGNVLQGIPFHFDDNLRSFYTGSFWALFNPFALLCGLTSIAMIFMQGGCYITVKTEGIIQHRAIRATRIMSVLLIIFFAIGGFFIAFDINGFVLTSAINHAAPSNPLQKNVALQTGVWLANFVENPAWWFAPVLGFLGALLASIFVRVLPKMAFLFSTFSIVGVITTVGLSMFPFILPSSSDPKSSLIVWDASASQLSLSIMFVCVLIFLPIILIYTAFVYRILRGKVTEKYINTNKDQVY